MANLGFTTTMSALSWGGSEELWSQTAEYALETGHHIYISIPAWKSLHPRLQNLHSKGAKLYRRYSSKSIQNKVYRAVNLLLHKLGLDLQPYEDFHNTKHWQHSFPKKLELLVISQGGVFCGIRESGLVSWLQQTKTPYIVVCQVNHSHLLLNEDYRVRALTYLRNAQQVAFVSYENLHTTEIQLASKLPNAVVVQNPLNLLDTSPVPWPHCEPLQMACVARLNIHAKGQDLLFQTFARSEWKERDFILNLYGSGEDEAYLRRLTEFLGIKDKVNFQGHVSNIRSIWETNHILIMPSHYEGSSLSLLEAMVCGRPAVVSHVGSNFDWVDHKVNGFHIKSLTIADLSQALEEMWNHREMLHSMGMKAREIAMENRFDKAPQSFMKLVQKEQVLLRKSG